MIAAAHSAAVTILQILGFILVAIAVIVASLHQKRTERHRAFDLETLAARLAFDSFSPNHDESFVMGWGFLSRLARGADRYAFNLLRGTYHEQPMFVFDHHYETGTGKNREDHFGTILMLVVKEAFPNVTIGPESLSAKLEAAFGLGDEVNFESAEFSRKFCVRSPDKKFAYDVCNPQMIDYLLANPSLQIEIQGPVISLAFEPQLPVGNIEFNLQRLVEIRSRLPQYLFTNS